MRINAAIDSDDESQDRFEEADQSSEEEGSSEGEDSSEVASNADVRIEQSALEDLVPVLDDLDDRPKKRARGLASQGSSKRPPLPKTVHTRGKTCVGDATIMSVFEATAATPARLPDIGSGPGPRTLDYLSYL